MYDLNLMPIHIHQGETLRQLSGFYAAGPPRRAVRSRSEDPLILSLITRGNDRISPESQQAWLERLAHNFYRNSGSVTSALRTLIETLNLTMMEKNLKFAQESGPTMGAINLAAVHRRSLYIAQSGLTHAYILNHQGLQHFYDSSQTDRGLGFSRSPNIRYYQAELGTGAYFFMTDTPPETWTDELLFLDGFPSFEQLQRRLLNQAPSDFRLDLVQIVPGEGQINTVQPSRRPTKSSSPIEAEPEAQPAAEPLAAINGSSQEEDALVGERSPVEGSPVIEEPEPAADLNQTQAIRALPVDEKTPAVSETTLEPAQEETLKVDERELTRGSEAPATSSARKNEPQDTPEIPVNAPESKKVVNKAARLRKESKRKAIRKRGLKGLSAGFDWWRKARETVDTFFKDLIARWSPEGTDGVPKLSRGSMLLIAVVVPLVVVGIAVGVYLARGKSQQYQYYYDQAQIASRAAMAAEDPQLARTNWSQALEYLDEAESFRSTDDIEDLRSEAQTAMDRLDGAVRLDYRPAIIGSLYAEINITRIISYGPDLYLFDETGGRVIHALRTTRGYDIDPEFVCSAGNFGGGGVDTLVDMAPLPINNPYQAHLLAVDARGNVAYCGPGQDPVVQMLPAPEGGSGEIERITYASNHLYVLSPSANSIQVYRQTNGQFLDPPYNFFEGAENGVKPDLSQTLDLAVNGDELYLLREDGKLAFCEVSGLPSNPVICENPVSYVDGRPGLEDQVMDMPESNYVSLLYTSPPDPAISILDATNADIYRFSMTFRLHQRLRPNLGDYEIESPEATAFTIGIDRVAYLAFGHQVFYAYIE